MTFPVNNASFLQITITSCNMGGKGRRVKTKKEQGEEEGLWEEEREERKAKEILERRTTVGGKERRRVCTRQDNGSLEHRHLAMYSIFSLTALELQDKSGRENLAYGS